MSQSRWLVCSHLKNWDWLNSTHHFVFLWKGPLWFGLWSVTDTSLFSPILSNFDGVPHISHILSRLATDEMWMFSSGACLWPHQIQMKLFCRARLQSWHQRTGVGGTYCSAVQRMFDNDSFLLTTNLLIHLLYHNMQKSPFFTVHARWISIHFKNISWKYYKTYLST